MESNKQQFLPPYTPEARSMESGASEKHGVPQGSNAAALQFQDLPPSYSLGQRQIPQDINLTVVVEPQKSCCTWRNSAISITIFKAVISLIGLVLLVYLADITQTTLDDTFGKDYSWELHSTVSITIAYAVIQAIVLLAYIVGLCGAIKRNSRSVLICIVVNITADITMLIMAFSLTDGEVSSKPFFGLLLEAYFFYVLIRYYKYLKMKEALARNATVDSTVYQLLTQNSRRTTIIRSN